MRILKSLAYDIVLGYVISILNLAINENGIQIVDRRNNFPVCSCENSIKKLIYAANQ